MSGAAPKVLLLIALLVLTGCAATQPLDVLIVGIEPIASSNLEQRMRVELRIINPNDQAFAATGMSLTLNVNGQPLARGVSSDPIAVPRLGETLARIEVSTSLFDIARQVLRLAERPKDLTYSIDGRLYRGGWRLPVSFESKGVLPGFESHEPHAGPAQPQRPAAPSTGTD